MEASRFSGIVSLSYRNRPVWALTSGRMAGPESGLISAGTRFNLGSASKMFTAVAVAQLVDAGKVHLDDPIGHYVEGLDPDASRVTVRQLLTHTSGLGDFFRPENMEAMLRARTASDILPLIRNEKPAFAPGSRFSYSNSGFALLGILVERVSGLPYGDYLRAHIFLPAGMRATGLDPRPLATLAVGMTRGPRPEMRGSASPDHPPAMILVRPGGTRTQTPIASGALRPAPGATEGYGSPAGGLFSTAGDMQKFIDALLANRLARAETTAAMIAPQVEVAPASGGQPARHYGYGFGVGTFEGHRWFGHNGGTLGANTEVVAFRDDQWSLVVLSNRDPPEATELLRRLRSLMFHPDLARTCGA
jgi:CubicO group peptidase (beta-lactamase class C family)